MTMTAVKLETHFLSKATDNARQVYLSILQNDSEIASKEYAKCRDDPWWWLTGWVKTLDEHDEQNPIRNFPARDYLRHLVFLFMNNNQLAVKKSRQMMVSWLFCALFLWDAMFHQGRRLVIQSKKADDADALIKRGHFVWSKLPAFLRQHPANPQKRGNHVYGSFEIPEIHSEIMGLAEGSDQIRMYTASRVLEDEFQLQDEGREILEAVQPTLTGGGSLILIGTALPGFFAKLTNEVVEHIPARWQGIQEWVTGSGLRVCRLHYSADPEKDEVWAARVEKAMTMDGNRDGWLREYEIDDSIEPGQKFFPEFNSMLHVAERVFDEFTPIVRGWDFGYHYPALVVGQFDIDDRFWFLGSFRETDVLFDDFLAHAIAWCEEKFGKNVKYYDHCDPAGAQQTHRNLLTDVAVMAKAGILASYSVLEETKHVRLIRMILQPRGDGTAGLMFDSSALEMIQLFSAGLVFKEKKGIPEDGPAEIHPWIDLFDGSKYLISGSCDPLSGVPHTHCRAMEHRAKALERKAARKWWREKKERERDA